MSSPIFIIEHCEPKLYDWCFIEYKHLSAIVGKQHLWFCHTRSKRLTSFGTVISKSVLDLDLKNACVLDPFAKQTLTPKDTFDYFIFGGILGDNPPSKKTKQFLTSKTRWISRNLGREQMATDDAVYVTKKIVEGTPLEKIPFQQDIEIDIRNGESILLPYKYVLIDGKPLISQELVEKLRRQKGF